MKWIRLMGVLGILLAAGCAGGGQSATVVVGDMPPVPTPQSHTGNQSDNAGMQALASMRKPIGNDFVAADDAEQCPMIHVTTPDGKEQDMQPGRAGYVTIVVVWSMDTVPGRTALLVVNDLVQRYARFSVRGVGIVEPTEHAAEAVQAAASQKIRMALYFDDLKQKALRALAGAAGASNRTGFPAIFIIDRRLRLRFYRLGFRFSRASVMDNGRRVDQWNEDVPKDETIEHYLAQILAERY